MGADGWLRRFDAGARDGTPRVAVKDAIDVVGYLTLVGSPAVAAIARPAARDAACVARLRAAGAQIVGKTALTELCWSASGLNIHEQSPVNPLDPTRIPGGSSSGSAVVVARREADLSLGTDTGGSIRIPAACCGITGLKTTWGRIPLDGIWPLSASLDTVGPLAATIAGLELGMQMLDPTYQPTTADEPSVGRLRPTSSVQRVVDDAVDEALHRSGWRVEERDAPWWAVGHEIAAVVLTGEGGRANAKLMRTPDLLSKDCREHIEAGLAISDEALAAGRTRIAEYREHFLRVLDGVDALVLPTLRYLPPPIDETRGTTSLTQAANSAGLPALSLPIPVSGSALPGSIQLIGRPYSEDVLLALGAQLERALSAS